MEKRLSPISRCCILSGLIPFRAGMSFPQLNLRASKPAHWRLLLIAALIAVIAASSFVRAVEAAGRETDAMLTQISLPNVVGAPMQHNSLIFSAQFSPDGRRIVTASKDGTARLWDSQTGIRLASR